MKYVPNSVTRAIGRQLLVGQKYSPELLFGAGVIGVATTVVMACKATLKLEEVLDETEAKSAQAERARDIALSADYAGKSYTEEDYKQDLMIIKVRGVLSVCKLYAPSAVIAVASIAALTGSHVILSRRNVALTAAYTVLEKSFGEYRDRVAAKYGRDKEDELYYNLEACEIDVDGKKVPAMKASSGGSAPYARCFDESSRHWQRTLQNNQFFIQSQQSYANDLLRARGHVFLNEIYDMLGFERTKEGAVVGWLSDGNGDGFIDFGIFRDGHTFGGVKFVNGDERSVWLDFNVDGIIYNKI